MNANLARLLLRLSEAGEPAILWGRQAKHHFGKGFDWLLADGVLIEQAPADEWEVCPTCECGADSRVIQRINDRLIAICPFDRADDSVLDGDDVRSFRVIRPGLVHVLTSVMGLTDEPSEIAPGFWKVGVTRSQRAIYLGLDGAAVLQHGIVHAVRTIDPSASIMVFGPRLAAADQIRFWEAGFGYSELSSALVDDGAGRVTIDPEALEPTAGGARLRLQSAARTGELDGVSLVLSNQPFRLLYALAEKALTRQPFMSTRDIEDEISRREGRDIVRELREGLVASGLNAEQVPALLQNKHGRGWRLALSASAIDLDA